MRNIHTNINILQIIQMRLFHTLLIELLEEFEWTFLKLRICFQFKSLIDMFAFPSSSLLHGPCQLLNVSRHFILFRKCIYEVALTKFQFWT